MNKKFLLFLLPISIQSVWTMDIELAPASDPINKAIKYHEMSKHELGQREMSVKRDLANLHSSLSFPRIRNRHLGICKTLLELNFLLNDPHQSPQYKKLIRDLWTQDRLTIFARAKLMEQHSAYKYKKAQGIFATKNQKARAVGRYMLAVANLKAIEDFDKTHYDLKRLKKKSDA